MRPSNKINFECNPQLKSLTTLLRLPKYKLRLHLAVFKVRYFVLVRQIFDFANKDEISKAIFWSHPMTPNVFKVMEFLPQGCATFSVTSQMCKILLNCWPDMHCKSTICLLLHKGFSFIANQKISFLHLLQREL